MQHLFNKVKVKLVVVNKTSYIIETWNFFFTSTILEICCITICCSVLAVRNLPKINRVVCNETSAHLISYTISPRFLSNLHFMFVEFFKRESCGINSYQQPPQPLPSLFTSLRSFFSLFISPEDEYWTKQNFAINSRLKHFKDDEICNKNRLVVKFIRVTVMKYSSSFPDGSSQHWGFSLHLHR